MSLLTLPSKIENLAFGKPQTIGCCKIVSHYSDANLYPLISTG